MTVRADHRLTVDEFRLMPEGPPFYQLVDGELFMTPSPAFHHNRVILKLASALDAHATMRGAGTVTVAPSDVYLGKHDVFQPDILFVAAAHAARIEKDGVHGAPDLVVEVLSPSTRKLDLAVKRLRYASAGVIEAWYVDLDMDEVLVYRLQENAAAPVRTLRRGEKIATPLLPGFEISVDDVIDAK